MIQANPLASDEKLIDTTIELARCSKFHRMIVVGSKCLTHMFALHHRGYNRVVAAATCCLQRNRYDVGLVDWRLQRIKALESKLDWLAPFLAPTSVLVIWVDGSERAAHQRLGSMLERLGFRIEVGTLCEHGLAISARRQDANEQTMAA